MKNFETILNVGEDAANYIKIEKTSHFEVTGVTFVQPKKRNLIKSEVFLG